VSGATQSGSMPAIAGAAQVVQRPGDWRDPSEARGPIELMVDAARAAADDAGALGLLARVGWVGVAGGWWRFRNPGQLVAERIGAPDAHTALSSISGTAPQDLVAIAAERIARGNLDVALVVGGEARWTHQRLKRAGQEPPWPTAGGDHDPEQLPGFPDDLLEEARVLGAAATAYALFDDSLRAARGESIDDHRDRIAQLWASFSTVAVANPYAWDRSPKSAAEIREPSPDNRMISFPYTKAMVANNTVDMGSAVLLCSVGAARSAGLPADRLVFPQVITSSHETWKVAHRHELHGCPALTTAGKAAFEHAGLGPDEVEHIDLYACFPSIVQMSAGALGLDEGRPLTVTGGLGFAGGPVGNATGQSIAAMVERVRGGGIGLVHGNGGNATKHSFAIYSTDPPAQFARIDCNDLVDHRATVELPDGWTGKGTVEAATVVYDREGPSHVLAALRAEPGQRVWATAREDDLIAEAMGVGLAGQMFERTVAGKLRR
jgi:acetyl-CoA C-acetyltransferase